MAASSDSSPRRRSIFARMALPSSSSAVMAAFSSAVISRPRTSGVVAVAAWTT
jgi:hypothetical protein